MTEELSLFEKIGALMIALCGVVMIQVAAVGSILLQYLRGTYGEVIASLLMFGLAIVALLLLSAAQAVVSNGYSRAFWQLLGIDLSPEQSGETA